MFSLFLRMANLYIHDVMCNLCLLPQSEIFKALERTRLLVGDKKESNYSRCGRTDRGVSSTGQVDCLGISLSFSLASLAFFIFSFDLT